MTLSLRTESVSSSSSLDDEETEEKSSESSCSLMMHDEDDDDVDENVVSSDVLFVVVQDDSSQQDEGGRPRQARCWAFQIIPRGFRYNSGIIIVGPIITLTMVSLVSRHRRHAAPNTARKKRDRPVATPRSWNPRLWIAPTSAPRGGRPLERGNNDIAFFGVSRPRRVEKRRGGGKVYLHQLMYVAGCAPVAYHS
jgi:hypothetical protein